MNPFFLLVSVGIIVTLFFFLTKGASQGPWETPTTAPGRSPSEEANKRLQKAASVLTSEVFLSCMYFITDERVGEVLKIRDGLNRLRHDLGDNDPHHLKSKKSDPREWYFIRLNLFSRLQLVDGIGNPHPLSPLFPRLSIAYEGRVPVSLSTSELKFRPSTIELTVLTTRVTCKLGSSKVGTVYVDKNDSVVVEFRAGKKGLAPAPSSALHTLFDELMLWVQDRNSNERQWTPDGLVRAKSEQLMRSLPNSFMSTRTLGTSDTAKPTTQVPKSSPPVITHKRGATNPSPTTSSVHSCPRCSSEMVKRTNSSTKVEFWGCVRFPKCRGSLNLNGTYGRNSSSTSWEDNHNWNPYEEAEFDSTFASFAADWGDAIDKHSDDWEFDDWDDYE